MQELMQSFSTNQCDVYVYDTNLILNNTKIYSIISIHRSSGSINTRFGNLIQIESIIKTYKKDFQSFHLQNI